MSILRTASTALKNALAAGPVPFKTEIFTVNLASGSIFRWTSWPAQLVVTGQLYVPFAPWLQAGRWGITNTMEVPTLEVDILDNTVVPFGGNPTLTLKQQLIAGVFDGATLSLERIFMPTPGDTSTYGGVELFKGDIGQITMLGAKSTLKVRGANSRMSVQAPVNVFQPSCLHTFCDQGCTLSAVTFTANYTVVSASASSITVVAAPLVNTQVKGGVLTMTSGNADGFGGSVIDFVSSAGNLNAVTLAKPLPVLPAFGDTLTLFYGCDKLLATCTGVYGNAINFRGFPFIPSPSTTSPR